MRSIFLVFAINIWSTASFADSVCNEIARRVDISDLSDKQLLDCQSQIMIRAICNHVSHSEIKNPSFSMIKTPKMLEKECIDYALEKEDGTPDFDK